MRKYPRNRYVSRTYKRECDICGQDYLRSEMNRTWDGKIVCIYDFDPKQQADEVPPPGIFRQRPFKRD